MSFFQCDCKTMEPLHLILNVHVCCLSQISAGSMCLHVLSYLHVCCLSQISAGSMSSVDVLLTEPGTWQLGCNVLEHAEGGIAAMYKVR